MKWHTYGGTYTWKNIYMEETDIIDITWQPLNSSRVLKLRFYLISAQRIHFYTRVWGTLKYTSSRASTFQGLDSRESNSP